MRIGIIGSGNIGATLARLFVGAGHEVAISNSRGPASLASLVAELGAGARAATVEEAAAFGEVVVEAVPFGRYRELPAEALAGKIVVTASNYYPERDGAIELGGRAQSELVAEHLAGARVVKAFNTIWYQHLQSQGDPGKPLDERRVIVLAGDDAEAKRVIVDLISEIGFGPLDAGSLHESTRQEPDAPIYNRDVTLAEARKII
ncbi:MAG TPA: NAD(P)-binding domain-containing protein [Roseiflexaceae bacterium]|nr:NAD(P)-binding domain-containing protein [Roseiflexaceae bacterium]